MPSALTDADLDRLDELLAGAPAPLQPLDAVALDGFLCGVLVQPQRIGLAQWLPAALDVEHGVVPEEVDAAWLAEVTRLVERHHDALRTQLAEGSFEPLLPAEPVHAPDEDPDLPKPSRVLARWVAGFAHAAEQFPALAELPDDRVADALDRIWRHLPAASEYERDARDALNREWPLATLQTAIEDLVAAVVEISDQTEAARYWVAQRRLDSPKVGRNDPCPCGSGKKFKACCGKAAV
jgi:uncharacterized protein